MEVGGIQSRYLFVKDLVEGEEHQGMILGTRSVATKKGMMDFVLLVSKETEYLVSPWAFESKEKFEIKPNTYIKYAKKGSRLFVKSWTLT